MKAPLDSYTLRARYFPAVLVVLPLTAALVNLLPPESEKFKVLASIVASAPVVVLLSHFGRDAGKEKQEVLFRKWGGAPAMRMLRHRDTFLNRVTRDRYRKLLVELIPSIELPSARKERASPDAADAVYLACTDFLREQTRDQARFQLLFEENVSYGFRRNLWAMKPAGVFVSILALIITLWGLVSSDWTMAKTPFTTFGSIIVATFMTVWWIFRITTSWVETAANAYAERLLGATEELCRNSGSKLPNG